MFSTIGSLVDRLQGLLSKGFLLAGLTPLVLLIFLNGGLVYLIFPTEYKSWFAALAPPKEENLVYWISLVLILFVGGLLLWNINPWLRQLWEGRYLPSPLKRLLDRENARQFSCLVDEKKQLATTLFNFRTNYTPYLEQLSKARLLGNTKQASVINPALQKTFATLMKTHTAFKPVPFPDVKTVFDLLKSALESQPAVGPLDKIQVDFIQLYEEAMGYYEYQYDRLIVNLHQRFPGDIGRIGPTTMANFAEVHRDYGLIRYGLDIERFWIHLLKLIRSDAELLPMLEEAKNQLDVSVAVTSVLALSTVVWVPTSLYAPTTWPFVLIAMLGPIAVTIAYEIALQSYRGFTEVVRSAIDLNRFKLLDALHLPTPSNSAEEVEIWKKLSSSHPSLEYSDKSATLVQLTPISPLSLWARLKKWLGFS